MSRARQEGKTEIEQLKKNLYKLLNKSEDAEVTKIEIVKLFYGKDSKLWWDSTTN